MKYPPHPLQRKEVEALLKACRGGFAGRRNRAHVALLYRTGIRAGESCSLLCSDLEQRDGATVIRVRASKSGADRDLALDGRALNLLEEWLKTRALLRGEEQDGPLFCTRTGKAVGTPYLRQLFPRLARYAGISRRVHPHALRHTFARELYDENNGVVEIQLALGHRKIATTQVYLQSIGATEVNAILRRRRW